MKQYNLAEGMRMHIARSRGQGRYSPTKSCQDTLNSFLRFCGQEMILYTRIDREMPLRYQDYLRDRECSWSMVSIYMRRIRRVYGLATEDGGAPFSRYLFKGIFLEIKSKQKKALSAESLCLLVTAPLAASRLRKTQRALYLIFLFCGMVFVSFVHLEKSDIRSGVLGYSRQKADTPMLVEIQPIARELLAALMTDTLWDSSYLFVLLSRTKTGEEAFREYTSTLADFSGSLKELANACGMTKIVASYPIRRSLATTLKERDVLIEIISELLGH